MNEREPPSPRERQSLGYERVARYSTEETAGRAYFEAQEAILQAAGSDLSVFRLQLDQISHVAILGLPPPRSLARRLDRIFSTGETATLPDEILNILQQRRADALKIGPWVEGHYRPGRHF